MGVLACSLAALLLAGSGGPGRHLDTTIQDDAQLLARPAVIVRQTMRTIAAAGADRVRLTANWSAIAPQPRAAQRPGAPFDPRNPGSYPKGSWDRLDTAVSAARAAGLQAMIDIGFWTPRWAVLRASANPARQRYAPNAGQFAAFAGAVARRYGPAVHLYTVWNEPNHPSFLAPQWRGKRPVSPHVYRGMYQAAYTEIKHVRPDAQVLMGNTAATGGTPGHGGVPPLRFLRTMACVNDRLEPLRVPECAHFQPLQADGYANHPYSRTSDPAAPAAGPDDATLSATPKLEALLHALVQRGRIARDLPIYQTEYGYESRPDDPYAPFDRERQAENLAKATFMAWQDGDTRMFAQFLLRDVNPAESGRAPDTRGYYRDWQTGLYAADGSPKPALTAFRMPFWIERHETPAGPFALAWGLIRPGHGPQTVRLEQQGPDGVWRDVRASGPTCADSGTDFLTDATGAFVATTPAPPATAAPPAYRMVWRRPDGVWEPSLPVTLSAP
jgi:hypothetical protein